MSATPVRRGIDGDGLQTFLMACTDDAESDLAAVGDEYASHRTEKAEKTVRTERAERADRME